MIGEPFECAADRSAVHHSRAQTGDRVRQVQRGERFRLPAATPSQARADAADQPQQPRTEPVHQPSLERHEPGLEENEDREGDLDRSLLGAQVLLQRWHEQGPAVLEVRHRDHAENAEEEDEPAAVQEALELTDRTGVHGGTLAPRCPSPWNWLSGQADRRFSSPTRVSHDVGQKAGPDWHGRVSAWRGLRVTNSRFAGAEPALPRRPPAGRSRTPGPPCTPPPAGSPNAPPPPPPPRPPPAPRPRRTKPTPAHPPRPPPPANRPGTPTQPPS